jgi:hypothetical protein
MKFVTSCATAHEKWGKSSSTCSKKKAIFICWDITRTSDVTRHIAPSPLFSHLYADRKSESYFKTIYFKILKKYKA